MNSKLWTSEGPQTAQFSCTYRASPPAWVQGRAAPEHETPQQNTTNDVFHFISTPSLAAEKRPEPRVCSDNGELLDPQSAPVPHQRSLGGETYRLGSSKQGDSALSLLVHSGRDRGSFTVTHSCKNKHLKVKLLHLFKLSC